MKTLLGAFALVIAAPAVAQGTPVSDPHAGHAQHDQQQERQPEGHGDHKMDCCKDCCDKMKHDGRPKGQTGAQGEDAAPQGHTHRN